MRAIPRFPCSAFLAFVVLSAATFAVEAPSSETVSAQPEKILRAIYSEALVHGQAYENLRDLVANYPGRLGGSATLEHAVSWVHEKLTTLQPDRVFLQDAVVTHWERGEPESVFLLDPTGVTTLTACALGGSPGTGQTGVMAQVVEVHSIDELTLVGASKVKGKIVFFNGPMDPTVIHPSDAYGTAGAQRTRGPAAAAKLGAVGALVRSLTQAEDDVPHTGVTIFPAGTTKIPAAALSTHAADRLSAALRDSHQAGTALQVGMKINAQWYPDSPSHNVIGEIRGTTFPDQIMVVGGHLDSWDIAPGAHDDGAGIVQSMEVLRIFRALGIKPRHTLRCVAFVNEENGGGGARAYAAGAKAAGEKHIFALETDSGGFQPAGFRLTSRDHQAATRASRWLPLLHPYAIYYFEDGDAGFDVTPLLEQGAAAGELATDSQRYFDIHHTRNDSLDKVNPRELHLGAAALASLIHLVDTQGL